MDCKADAFDLNWICVDLARVRSGIARLHVPDVEVPVAHERPLHGHARVVDDSPVVRADENALRVHPNDLKDRTRVTLALVVQLQGHFVRKRLGASRTVFIA